MVNLCGKDVTAVTATYINDSFTFIFQSNTKLTPVAWIRYIQESEESTMSRYEQEQAQQRTTRPRKRRTVNNDLRLTEAKKNDFNGRLDLEDYQATLRSLSYRYMVVLDNDSNSKDDDEYEPKI
ncbi:unnamed protein product [Didymodactylos carnosus]|uniref:Uncharacterized protein n=1 Tax=Didymodactylos carnosus TaxID=1234261 RepID=A0A8S2I0R4_9BILA|nr:unnamed protein product [Didymodactylos carnosus]CAF3680543.1 unnamed protein product [Didymodactylos carnosus]